MSELSSDQVLFVLKVLGKAPFYLSGQSFPGESFDQAFLREINNPLGSLAITLAQRTQLSYSPDQQLIINQPISVDQIQTLVQSVGMRIPPIHAEAPLAAAEAPLAAVVAASAALGYVETYGHLYRPFSSQRNVERSNQWLYGQILAETSSPAEQAFKVLHPTLLDYDIYLDGFLRTHLRDLYTDFDLIEQFPMIESLRQLDHRAAMIDAVVQTFHPAGEFWFSFGFETVRLEHEYQGQTINYDNVDQIKTMAEQGQLRFDDHILDSIGLYQLAFLVLPEYFSQVYGISPSSTIITKLWDLLTFFLGQITLYETEGGEQYRFGPEYEHLNYYLDLTTPEITPSPTLTALLEKVTETEAKEKSSQPKGRPSPSKGRGRGRGRPT